MATPGPPDPCLGPQVPITSRSPVPLEACQSRPRMSMATTLPPVCPRLPSSRSCWRRWNPPDAAIYDVHYCVASVTVGSSLGICPQGLPQELLPHPRPGPQHLGAQCSWILPLPRLQVSAVNSWSAAGFLGLLSASSQDVPGQTEGFSVIPQVPLVQHRFPAIILSLLLARLHVLLPVFLSGIYIPEDRDSVMFTAGTPAPSIAAGHRISTQHISAEKMGGK